MPHKKNMNPMQVFVDTTPARLRDVPQNKTFDELDKTNPDHDKPMKAALIHLHGLPKNEVQMAKVLGRQDQITYFIPENPLMIEVLHKLMVNKCYNTLKKINKLLPPPPPEARIDDPNIKLKDVYSRVSPQTLVMTTCKVKTEEESYPKIPPNEY